MIDKNTNNIISINQKTLGEKSINMNTNKELDEYDKYLKIELENFKKPSPKKFSINNIEYVDNTEDPNLYNERNFIMENEESNIEKNSNFIRENFDKSIKQNKTYNNSNHDDYSTERENNNSLDKNINLINNNETHNQNLNMNITQNFKNTSINDKTNDVILNNLNNNKNINLINSNDNNPNQLFHKNVLLSSENGNPNCNNYEDLNIMNIHFDNYNNLNNQSYKNRMINYQNLNINTDLNDYLTDKVSNHLENNMINNYDNELIDDNEKYMFSNNIEYTNYNLNTNYNQENENTVDIINSNKKPETNKSKNRTNFDFFSNNTNFANNLLQNNYIINSNNHNYIDYRDAFMKEGKVHNDVFFINDKVTEYDSILNNNNNIKNHHVKSTNQDLFKNNVELENIKYSYETDLNEKLEHKLKKAALSLNNKNTNNGFLFDFNPKRAAYDKAVYCSFTPKNIKTLSDQTLSNSELMPSKKNKKSSNTNIHENVNSNYNEIDDYANKNYYTQNQTQKEEIIINENINSLANIKEKTIQINNIKEDENSNHKQNNYFNKSEYAENNQLHICKSENLRREYDNDSSIQTNREREKWNLISEKNNVTGDLNNLGN